jgi:hypothetical protein
MYSNSQNGAPRHISLSVANDGYPDLESCEVEFLADGSDNGLPMRLSGNVDYDTIFIGGYNMGDTQWHAHASIDCLSGLYWKNTKNFADGCSAHVKGGFFHNSNGTYFSRLS